jgi:hypothetical protein
VIWIILLILLALILGLGTLLKITFWVLVILAIIAILGFLFGTRSYRSRGV